MTGGYKMLAVLPFEGGLQNPIDAIPAPPGPDEIRFIPMSITLQDG